MMFFQEIGDLRACGAARRFLVTEEVARVTGLEPATSGVTGRHSNQLSYHRAIEG